MKIRAWGSEKKYLNEIALNEKIAILVVSEIYFLLRTPYEGMWRDLTLFPLQSGYISTA